MCARLKVLRSRRPRRWRERIAADVRRLPGVTDTLTTIGGGQQEQVNVATIYVKLQPIEERDVTQNELMVRARTEILAEVSEGISGPIADQCATGRSHFRRRLSQC